MDSPQIKEEYTAAEVAGRLSLSVRWIQKLAKRTRLGTIRRRKLTFSREHARRITEIVREKHAIGPGNPNWKRHQTAPDTPGCDAAAEPIPTL